MTATHVPWSWHSVAIKDSTDKLLPGLEALDQNIDRLASNIDVKLQSLLQLFFGPEQRL